MPSRGRLKQELNAPGNWGNLFVQRLHVPPQTREFSVVDVPTPETISKGFECSAFPRDFPRKILPAHRLERSEFRFIHGQNLHGRCDSSLDTAESIVDAMTDEVPLLEQATIYLAEPTVNTFEELIKPTDEADEVGYDIVQLDGHSGLDGLLVVQRYQARPPNWVDPLRSLVEGELPPIDVQSAGAALIIRLAGRIFAFTFGQGRHLLNPDLLVDDFGLRVAANTIDPLQVRSVDGRTFQRGILLTRRQASRPGRVEALGVQPDREMYRALTGRSRREGEGRVHGSTSLGVTRPIPLSGLEAFGQELIRDYAGNDYRASFSSLDRMRPLARNSPEAVRLDTALIDALHAPDLAPYLAPPALLDWEHVSGFRFSTEPRGPRYDDLDLRTYLLSLDAPVTIDQIHDDEVRLLDRDSPRIVSRWQIRKCLVWETTLDDRAFVLADGRWYDIDRAYLESVNNTVATAEPADIVLPSPSVPNLDERAYNQEAALAVGGVLLDRQLARVTTERGGFELCDIFVSPNRLVHVKRGIGSQELTYLFAQGVQSAEGYRNAREVRARLRELVNVVDAAQAALLPLDERPDPDDFIVTYAVVTDSPARVPRDLPFFARAALARSIRTLRELDFRVATLGVSTRP
jgi:uncharacterized protein (TIGR04141 family)